MSFTCRNKKKTLSMSAADDDAATSSSGGRTPAPRQPLASLQEGPAATHHLELLLQQRMQTMQVCLARRLACPLYQQEESQMTAAADLH